MSVHLNDLSQVYLEQVSVASRARNAVADDRLDAEQEKTNVSMNRLRQQSNRVARADAAAAARKVERDVTTSNNTGPQRPKPGTVTGRRIEDPRPTGSRPTGYRVEEKEDDEPKMKKNHKKHDREDDNGEENNDDEPRWQNSDGDDKWYEPGEDVAAPKKKKKITTEGFSNWRNDLIEVIEPERLPSKMKEGNVDNYNGKNKCVTINPEVKEQVQILESFELSEEYITETVNSAVDYFMEEGINEDGLEIIINELGIEEFVSFVFEIGNEVLTEARTLLGKKKNPQKLPKGTAPTTLTKAAVKKYGTTRNFKSPSKTGVIKKKLPTAKVVEKAKETQTSKKPVRDAIARGVFGVVKAYQAGMERHRKAMNLAKETGKTVAKAAKVGAQGASEFGKGVKSGATATVDAAKKAKKVINAGYEFEIDEKFSMAADSSKPQSPKPTQLPKSREQNHDDWKDKATEWGERPAAGKRLKSRANAVVGTQKRQDKETGIVAHYEPQGSLLDEKATSEQQQKLFGLALSVKRGETPRSEVSAEVLKIVDSMSEKEIRKYAKTKHEGIPKKVEESLSGDIPMSSDEIQLRKRSNEIDKKIAMIRQRGLKKTPVEEQTKKPSALDIVRQQVIAKHGAASIMGTPEHKAATEKRAGAKKPQPKPKRYEDDVYSKNGLGGIRGYRSGD